MIYWEPDAKLTLETKKEKRTKVLEHDNQKPGL